MNQQLQLLSSRRFLPLFVTQFLGACNDNIFKNALLILITYDLATRYQLNGPLLITIASGIFILPFFIFSATAGQIADRYERSYLIRIIKLFEIGIVSFAIVGFYLSEVYLLLAVLFLLGTQSTFFGPIKYSLLPDHLQEKQLIAGNGLIEMGTFIAILLGTIIGSLAIRTESGVFSVAILLFMVAFIGWLASRYIPTATIAAPKLKINYNIVTETALLIRYLAQHKTLFIATLGISWFWLLGATFLSQFPSFTKLIIGGDETVVTLFLTIFSVGISIGSILCNKLLNSEISARYVPIAAAGMSVFSIDLYFASIGTNTTETLINVHAFMGSLDNLRILLDLVMIAICGGLYIVLLYSIVQQYAETSHRSRVIAGLNIMNALFMVVSAVATSILLLANNTVAEIFLYLGISNIAIVLIATFVVAAAKKTNAT